MASLYELTGQMLYLMELLEDPDTDEQVIADTMEAVDLDIEDKADGYAKIIRSLQAQEVGMKTEIERLQARKTAVQNNIDRLKRNLEESMIAIGKTKFKTDLFSFGIQKNPPTVDIIGDVPEEFLIPQEPKIDRKAIIAYVKEHGNTDYAELMQGESLRIR